MPKGLLYMLTTDDFCLSVCLKADLAFFPKPLPCEKDAANGRRFLQLFGTFAEIFLWG